MNTLNRIADKQRNVKNPTISKRIFNVIIHPFFEGFVGGIEAEIITKMLSGVLNYIKGLKLKRKPPMKLKNVNFYT